MNIPQKRQCGMSQSGGLRDLDDSILRTVRILDVGEKHCPTVALQLPIKFAGDAGFFHAPLPSQQRVISIADAIFQELQLTAPVGKVAAAYPISRLLFRGFILR